MRAVGAVQIASVSSLVYSVPGSTNSSRRDLGTHRLRTEAAQRTGPVDVTQRAKTDQSSARRTERRIFSSPVRATCRGSCFQ